MGAIECYGKAISIDFKAKIKYFMQKAAIAIIGEDGGTVGHAERLVYAKLVLAGTASVEEFAIGVATNSTISTAINGGSEPTDNDIEFTVNSMINDFAGYDA